MEGRVYNCTWVKTEESFKTWVIKKHSIVGFGKTFEEADDKLWEAICNFYGDGENVREYNPPEPIGDKLKGFFNPPIVTICGNDHCADVTPPELIFAKGLCNKCGYPLGSRTDAALYVGDIPSTDGAFISIFKLHEPYNYNIKFFSEDFIALLTEAGLNHFKWRKIERPKRAHKIFYGLVPEKVVPYVGVKSLNYKLGVCEQCNQVLSGVYKYICREHIPNPLTSFLSGFQHDYDLCLPKNEWLAIAGKPGTRNLCSSDIRVVSSEDADESRTTPKEFQLRDDKLLREF